MPVMNLNKSNATNYQLIFPKLPLEKYYETSKEFTLNIYGAVVPSITLDQEEHRWQGAKAFSDNGEVTFGEWIVDFAVDSEFKNWKVIYNWMMAIHNNEDKYGYVRDKGYMVDAALYIMTNYRNKALMLRFYNIWPLAMSEVYFSKRDSGDDLLSNITFLYDRYEVF